MRTSGELHGATHVIETVDGGNSVVLVGLKDVSVDAALECAGSCEAFAVEAKNGVGAECLEVEPVVAVVWNGERAFPGGDGVGRQRVVALNGEVQAVVDLPAA